MLERSRLPLLAAVLVVGGYGCSDDEITAPMDELVVDVTPGDATVNTGETQSIAVDVTGGDPDIQAEWTCTSGDDGVAEAEASSSGCDVTGVSAGDVTVTVEAERGELSASVPVQITVEHDVEDPASVGIAELRDEEGESVDPEDISGRLDVTLDIDSGEETLQELTLFVIDEPTGDQIPVASLSFAADAGSEDEGVVAQDVAAEGTQQTVSFNTAEYERDEEGVTAPLHLNGEKALRATLEIVEDPDVSRDSPDMELVFENDNEVLVEHREDLSEERGAATAVEQSEGVRYWGGGTLVFEVIPLLYTDVPAEGAELAAEAEGDAVSLEPTGDEGRPFLFEADYDEHFGVVEDDPESAGHAFSAGESDFRTDEGEAIPVEDFQGLEGFHIDMAPPELSGEVAVSNDGELTVPDGHHFSTGAFALTEEPEDRGVGEIDDEETFRALLDEELVEDPVTGIADLDEAGENRWTLRLERVADALGNAVTEEQVQEELGDSEPFNVDRGAPEYENVLPAEEIIFRGTGDGEGEERHVVFDVLDPELADGNEGSGVDVDGVTVTVNEGDPLDAQDEALSHDGGSWALDVSDAGAGDGDGPYEVAVEAPDHAILPNVGERAITFLRDTTPPEVEYTDTPSDESTDASSVPFEVAGTISDDNGVDPERSRIEVRRPTEPGVFGEEACREDDGEVGELYEAGESIDRNEVNVGESFGEGFEVYNPDDGNEEKTYCVFTVGADVALDNEGNPDPNEGDRLTAFTVEWNP